MHGGDVNEFLDKVVYNEVAVSYKDWKYLFYGVVYDKATGLYSFMIDRTNADKSVIEIIYDKTAPTAEQCMEEFLRTPIIEGKTFWELEKDMTWIETYECC